MPTARPSRIVEFSDKDPRVGDWVLAVGNPFGLGGTVTAGIISAHNRDIGSGPYDYLQIDAAVNRGNSGGPSFDLDGKVVGMNTAIFSPSGGNVGIAFAVPAALVKEVVDQLQEPWHRRSRLARRRHPECQRRYRRLDRHGGGQGRHDHQGDRGRPGGQSRTSRPATSSSR